MLNMVHTLSCVLLLCHAVGAGPAGLVVPVSVQVSEAEARMQVGLAALDLGDWKAAVEAFERALEAPDSPPEVRLYLGVALWRAGRLEEAAQTLERSTEVLPRNAEAHLFLGLVRFELRRLPAAREALRRAASRDPTSAATRMGLARVHLNLAQLEMGIGEIEVAASLEPENAAIRTTRALLAFRGGDLEGAQEAVSRALELDPRDAEARFLSAEIALQNGEFDRARRLAAELVVEQPVDPRARYLLASALSGLGREPEAIAAFRSYRALREVTEDRSRGGMATAGVETGGAARGIPARARRRAIATSLVQRADTARQEGDGDRAELLAHLAEDIDEEAIPSALRIRGLVHYERNEFGAAAQLMQEVWDRGHRSASLAHDLALALIQSGEPARAAALLGPLLADPAWEGGGDAVLHYLEAVALLEAQRPEDAVQAAVRAARIDPELPSPHLLLSRAYEQLGWLDREDGALRLDIVCYRFFRRPMPPHEPGFEQRYRPLLRQLHREAGWAPLILRVWARQEPRPTLIRGPESQVKIITGAGEQIDLPADPLPY